MTGRPLPPDDLPDSALCALTAGFLTAHDVQAIDDFHSWLADRTRGLRTYHEQHRAEPDRPPTGCCRACRAQVPLTELDTVTLHLDGWRVCLGVARLPTLPEPDRPAPATPTCKPSPTDEGVDQPCRSVTPH